MFSNAKFYHHTYLCQHIWNWLLYLFWNYIPTWIQIGLTFTLILAAKARFCLRSMPSSVRKFIFQHFFYLIFCSSSKRNHRPIHAFIGSRFFLEIKSKKIHTTNKLSMQTPFICILQNNYRLACNALQREQILSNIIDVAQTRTYENKIVCETRFWLMAMNYDT